MPFKVLERSFRFVILIYLYILAHRHVRTSWQWRIWMVAHSPSVMVEFSAHSSAHPSSTHRSQLFWACMVSLTGQWLLVARLVISLLRFSLYYPSVVTVGVLFDFSLPHNVSCHSQVEVRPMMYVALTYDHRLIDGREAVTFLRKIKSVVEDPRVLLLDM